MCRGGGIRLRVAVYRLIPKPLCNVSCHLPSKFYRVYDMVNFIIHIFRMGSSAPLRRLSSNLYAALQFIFPFLPCVNMVHFIFLILRKGNAAALFRLSSNLYAPYAIYLPNFTVRSHGAFYLPCFTEWQFGATLPFIS